MNKRYCTHLQPIKCNFCTHWFSVTQTFAQLQRYCFNICPNCFDNFQYKIVHPTTYQVHEIKLIATSLFLGDSKSMLSDKFISLLSSHRSKSYLSAEKEREIVKVCEKELEVLEQIEQIIEPMQEKLDNLYKQIFKNLLDSWNSTTERTQKAIKCFTIYKQQQVSKLSDRTYNFKTDSNQIFQIEKYEKNLQLLISVFAEAQRLSQNKLVRQLEKVLEQFLKKNNSNILKEKSNQLATPNLKNLKGLREKLVDKTLISGKKLSVDINSGSKPKLINNASSKRLNLGKENSINNKNHNTSQKSIRQLSTNRLKSDNSLNKFNQSDFKTPRAFIDDQSFFKLPESKNSEMDEYRGEVSQIMKQKEDLMFQSYLQEPALREEQQITKNLGDREKLEHIIELKLRTVLTDKIWELINQKLNHVNINHYLKAVGGAESLQIIRFVKVYLTDPDFDCLLNFIKDKPNVHTLIVTNNKLTQASITAFINFLSRHPTSKLKNLYIGNNRVQTAKIKSLSEKAKFHNFNLYV